MIRYGISDNLGFVTVSENSPVNDVVSSEFEKVSNGWQWMTGPGVQHGQHPAKSVTPNTLRPFSDE